MTYDRVSQCIEHQKARVATELVYPAELHESDGATDMLCPVFQRSRRLACHNLMGKLGSTSSKRKGSYFKEGQQDDRSESGIRLSLCAVSECGIGQLQGRRVLSRRRQPQRPGFLDPGQGSHAEG